MSYDIFVRFKGTGLNRKGLVPDTAELGVALEDYLGAYLTEITWGGGRWTATLVGKKSWPLKRISRPHNHRMELLQEAEKENAKEDRWIEVFIGKDYVDVITRHQDEATNALALGFARLVARFWEGTLKDDD